jgi:hypothetical protein
LKEWQPFGYRVWSELLSILSTMPGMDKCSVMYFRSERNSASLSALQAYYALPLINIILIPIGFLSEGNILHRSHAPGMKELKTCRAVMMRVLATKSWLN